MLILPILIPLLGAGIIASLGRWPNIRETASVLTALILFCLVCSFVPHVQAGESLRISLFSLVPGLTVTFALEPLGVLFALIASGLWILTAIYAAGYLRAHHETHQTRFFTCFALAITAAMGIAFAGNCLTLFIFYEMMTLVTYPLVTHRGTPEAVRAGRIYISYLFGTSIVLFFFAITWTWFLAGTLDFTPGGILRGKTNNLTLGILLGLYVFGIGKAALMPFHRWLPNAMVAPAPVSALLHAVAVVKAGVFSVLKIVIYIFGLDFLNGTGSNEWLLYVAAGTILIASLIATTKDNLKARLAYSTISQLAYIVLGAALANTWGMIGGGMHILMHAFGKITLFFCAGAIDVATHKTQVSQMDHVGKTMPFTMLAFLVGSLSIIGLPPLGGAWSKWYLLLGAVESNHPFLVAILVLSSLLNIAYLLPIPIRAFFAASSAPDEPTPIKEAPLACVIPLCITATGCVVLFFFADEVYRFLMGMAESSVAQSLSPVVAQAVDQ
jgi:multicomponent Na+:H+ antiporter subunit D